MTDAEREAEVRWMAGRLAWPPAKHTGISSNALVVAVVLREGFPPRNYPHDAGDLRRCLMAVETAPEHLRESAELLYSELADIVARHAEWCC